MGTVLRDAKKRDICDLATNVEGNEDETGLSKTRNSESILMEMTQLGRTVFRKELINVIRTFLTPRTQKRAVNVMIP